MTSEVVQPISCVHATERWINREKGGNGRERERVFSIARYGEEVNYDHAWAALVSLFVWFCCQGSQELLFPFCHLNTVTQTDMADRPILSATSCCEGDIWKEGHLHDRDLDAWSFVRLCQYIAACRPSPTERPEPVAATWEVVTNVG